MMPNGQLLTTTSEELSFLVSGEPVAKGRPRMGRFGVFTPAETRAYEKRVKIACDEAIKKLGSWRVDDELVGPRGGVKRVPRAFAVEAAFCVSARNRGDVDNLLKAVLDGMNGVAYHDDRQVVEVYGCRRLAGPFEPCAIVTVRRVMT